MARVTGIGGIFFRATDPEALRAWYVEHLGLPDIDGYVIFQNKDETQPDAYSIWAPFKNDTEYFGSARQAFMINFRVDNLDAMLTRLRDAGVEVDAKIEDSEFGRFGWAVDPEGHRFELWEPPAPQLAADV
ncbi:VOC family protein [Bradymonadaceae bacterium TMQ3]|uniref:VOC family protein n=1 Tax=Lujinxingia sediminis TaxID=2480984 RepID=A0ABY0CWR8_9DELT|nr:VOC family protein [Lujinxingia sediminis]RDV40131.1 VOC family protein [Bradymonadaceae bacterium TMQ3]RVU48337.1 VOC family protein [Lujinxingia sediminis]TXC77639.1 VOC family protein [Bradymonadales bacterium TMQ1]